MLRAQEPMEQAQAAEAYRVLARKYRPARLSELIGQEALVATLRNAMASGRVAHAFLLSGIRGVGKTSTARIIARSLNCTGPDGRGGPTAEPCGVCPSCRALAEERQIDVIEMDAATRTGIDDIREIVDSVRYAPSASRYKIYIIDEVHMLSEKAFNGLLKTLEEPPPHAKFIFATTEVRKVPVTVLSRCQRFDLRRVAAATLEAHLSSVCGREGIKAQPEALRLIAAAAEGSVRDALSLLDQAIALSEGELRADTVQDMLGLGDRRRLMALLEAVIDADLASTLERFAELHDCGAEPAATLYELLELTHGLSRLRAGSSFGTHGPLLGEELARRAADLAAGLSIGRLARMWQMLLRGLDEVRSAPDAYAAAEMVLLRVACAADLPPPAELARWMRNELGPGGQAPAPSMARAERPMVIARKQEGGGSSLAAAELPARSVGPEPRPAEPADFESLLGLLRRAGEGPLVAFLEAGAHLIRFEPGQVELRPGANLPPDAASRLAEAATRVTGRRWVVALGRSGGEQTLASQRDARRAERIASLAGEGEVRRVLEAFPGAEIVDVRGIPEERDSPDAEGQTRTSEVERG
jgi:DNA polymerase III subunit gamma/tau